MPRECHGAAAAVALIVALAAALCTVGLARAADHTLAGRVAVVKVGKVAKIVLDPPPVLPSLVTGGRLRLSDAGPAGSEVVIELSGGEWKALGTPPGTKGFRYRGTGEANDPCAVVVKSRVVKIVCRGADVAPPVPLGGNLGVVLEVGGDRYCAAFGGREVRNDVEGLKRTDADAPAACPSTTLTCRETLDALGIAWSDGPALQGIADPVTVTFPLNGIAYHTAGGLPDPDAPMDCRLALALHAMAAELHPRGITAIEHLGIYNYRVIAGTTTLSQHAKGLAIDVAEFRGAVGEVYDVETDWVIDEPTCSVAPSNDEDRILHELVCAWYTDVVFDTILTPNYSADFRDHFHLELNPGTHFIE